MMNWETNEVIDYLINDEYAYRATAGMTADEIEAWVLGDNAPSGLYDSFDEAPKSRFTDVDWQAVAEHIHEEEENEERYS